MKTRCWLAGLICLAASSVEAGHRTCAPCATYCSPVATCAPCGPVCAPAPAPACAPALVEQTVLVPEMTTETRKVVVTEYKQEMQERVARVQRMVPKTETRTRDVTYLEMQENVRDVQFTVRKPVMRTVDVTYNVCVPEVITREGVRNVCRPTWVDEEREHTVMVPYTETKSGMRTVMKCVPVLKRSTICEDKGQWVQQEVAVPACAPCVPVCGGCAPALACGCAAPCNSACGSACAPATRMVWAPNIVQREVEVTVHEMQCVNEPYDYVVTLCKPEIRKSVVKVCKLNVSEEPFTWQETLYKQEQRVCQKQVCDWVDEVVTRQVRERVCVPKTKTEEFQVTTYDCVTEEVKHQVPVCVPVAVEKEITVQVCRMVEKKIMVPAPTTCAPAPVCCQ